MSHELRTPLNAVIGFSEIINRELFGTLGEARYRDYARLIHESGEHLLNVVNDILDMSKIEAGKFRIVKEPFDVAPLVKSCCDIMRHTAEQRSLSLIMDVAPGIPELPADKRACKQMLLNVISNAIKFTDPGGWVRVSARLRRRECRVQSSPTTASASPSRICRSSAIRSCRPTTLTTEAMTAPVSACRWSRDWRGSMAAASSLRARSGEGTTATIVLPLDGAGESVEAPLERPAVSAA